MIRSRLTLANPLGVTIRPPFDDARECREGALDLVAVADVNRDYIHAERRRHGLDYAELAGRRWVW